MLAWVGLGDGRLTHSPYRRNRKSRAKAANSRGPVGGDDPAVSRSRCSLPSYRWVDTSETMERENSVLARWMEAVGEMMLMLLCCS